MGEDQRCYVQYYLDQDPTSNANDHTCGNLTYDTHSGTDFALRSWQEMISGVRVTASAPGVVKAVRDGMTDKVFDPDTGSAALEGRDCGNGVVIAHEDGWETQYCHLRKDSVQVKSGDIIDTGDPLGLVGMSGRASFPHIHLSVRKDGVKIDPYSPHATATCGVPSETLWDTPIAYQPGGLIAAGFASSVPEYDDIKAGTAHSDKLAADVPAIVFWGFAFGSQVGDIMRLSITNADAVTVFTTDFEIERAQAQFFRAGGRKTANADWFKPGRYEGVAQLLRKGVVISDSVIPVLVAN
ncbi:MAG: M23 family metallopeptidase [Aliishimia sp.]